MLLARVGEHRPPVLLREQVPNSVEQNAETGAWTQHQALQRRTKGLR